VPGAAVTQFAVIDALLAGAYESGLRVAEARSIGDFGLGCVDHLGGEVVIVDGEAIECTLDGPPVAMDDDDILPFAIVCRFPDVPRVGLGEQDFAGFAASVEGALTSRNLFHAVRFDGVLSEVRVRAPDSAAFARFDLHLPTDDLFLRTELTHAEDHRIVALEGGVAVSAEEPS
jgi:acetolactate decarboxylase